MLSAREQYHHQNLKSSRLPAAFSRGSSISSTTYQKLSLKASDYDALTIFSARPSDFNDTSIPSGELWEEVVNKILKSAFGWGVEGNMDNIICRGRKGLDGLADFAKYFIVKQGVNEALFEGKLLYLMTALEEK